MGTEVIGVDISQPLPDDVFKTIDDAYNHYSVLVLRGQKLTPEQQIAFARLFGELEVSPRTQFALPGHPEILVLSNIIIDGMPIGNADAGRTWHTDMSYTKTPPRADRCSTPAKFRTRMGARSVTPYLPVPPLLTTRCRRR
jgi:taurine dioxygenase